MDSLRTKQRETILAVVRASSGHPTATWIYQQARRKIPRISLGTIYRNLRWMTGQGLLSEIRIGERTSRFEAVREKHSHLYCLACGQIQDLPLLLEKHLERKAGRISGYAILDHNLEMWGVCPSCQRKSGGKNLLAGQPSSPEVSARPKRVRKDSARKLTIPMEEKNARAKRN